MESNEKYFPVDIRSFRSTLRDIGFDLFLKMAGDHYAHVFSKQTGLDYNRLEKYIERGVSELYIRESEKTAFQSYSGVTAESVFNDGAATHEKRVAALLNMTEQNLAEIFAKFSVDDETADGTRKLIKGYVGLMTDDPQSLAVILKLVSYGNYLYYHSVAVSVFSLLLARSLGHFDTKTLEVIGLGGFLHDIGRTQLPKEVNESSTDLTEEQWKTMKTHPKLGLDMIEVAHKVPEEVRFIIYQHHEQPGGEGYPNGLRGSAIYAPARVVALCDGFSALISDRPFRKAYTVPAALALMQSEVGKYDPNLLKVLGSIFVKQEKRASAA